MIRYARLLAASAIGTGIGIGLILCLSLTPLLRPTLSAVSTGEATPVSLATTDWCSQVQSNDPDMQAWFDLQCAVHTAIFNDGDEPSAGYRLDEDITGPGLYDGLNHEDKEVQLEAIYVVMADLENEAPALFLAGVTAHMVIGKLHGNFGEVSVVGAVVDDPRYLDGPAFQVIDIPTGSEMHLAAQAAAIRDGVMVQEENDGFGPGAPAYPLATATSVPEALWVFESDLSVLHGSGDAVDPACEEAAYDQFLIDMTAADDNLANCLATALKQYYICLGAFAGTQVAICFWTGGVTCITAAATLIGCAMIHNSAMESCDNAFWIAVTAAQASLALALEACGVVLLEI